MKDKILKKYNKIKYLKLILAVMIDLIGVTTYLIPGLGEGGDFVWAPISGVLILVLFPNHKRMALGGVIEELLPFTDLVPTAFLMPCNILTA